MSLIVMDWTREKVAVRLRAGRGKNYVMTLEAGGETVVLSVTPEEAEGVAERLSQLVKDASIPPVDTEADLTRLTAERDALLEAAKEALYDSVDATTYPDGPCLPRETRDALRAAIRKVEGDEPHE